MLRLMASSAVVLIPTFIVFYETRGTGFYRVVFTASLVLLALLFLSDHVCGIHPLTSPHPQARKTAAPLSNKPYLTAFSVLTAISAVLLGKGMLAWMSGTRAAICGLPWEASLLLLFLSSFVYVQDECRNREASLFKGRPWQVLVLAASLVFCATLASIFWVKSLALYTAVMKATFSLTLGGALPVIIRTRKAGTVWKN